MANLKRLELRQPKDQHGNPVKVSIKVQVPMQGNSPARVLTPEEQANCEKLLRPNAPAGWLSPYADISVNEWMNTQSAITMVSIQETGKVFDLDNPIDFIQYKILIEKGIAASAVDRNTKALFNITDAVAEKRLSNNEWAQYYEIVQRYENLQHTALKVGFVITAGINPERVPDKPNLEDLQLLLHSLLVFNNQLDGEKVKELDSIFKSNEFELKSHILTNAALHYNLITDAGTGARNRYTLGDKTFQNLTALRKFIEAGLVEDKAVSKNLENSLLAQ